MFRNEGEARTQAFRLMFHMGTNPVPVAPEKWRSANGRWQYRAKPVDYNQNHVHMERWIQRPDMLRKTGILRWPAGQSRPR